MQLFITDFEKKWSDIKINNKEIINQVKNVLRMKTWETFFIQKENIRYEIILSDRDDKYIYGKAIKDISFNWKKNDKWIAISMSNKREKIELITQKLSEIWIKKIYFRPSERSIIRERNEKKIERINKIAKEAVEQSRWRFLPEIKFEKDISKAIKWKNLIIFDKKESISENWNDFFINKKENKISAETIWIIWPEWWLTENDYKNFWTNYKIISLWETVLRTETASIIAARIINSN